MERSWPDLPSWDKAERKGRGGTWRDSASLYIVNRTEHRTTQDPNTSLATKSRLAEKLVGSVLWGFVHFLVSGVF